MRPAMQAFPPVSRCAAGALDRETGQAGLGNRGDEPRFTPNSASCRVRFRFVAGEPKVDGTWPTCEMTVESLSCWPPESGKGFGHRQDLDEFSGVASRLNVDCSEMFVFSSKADIVPNRIKVALPTLTISRSPDWINSYKRERLSLLITTAAVTQTVKGSMIVKRQCFSAERVIGRAIVRLRATILNWSSLQAHCRHSRAVRKWASRGELIECQY